MTYENQGSLADAAAYYRKSIELDGKQAVAKNNLAMVLAHQDTKLPEATTLASDAIMLQPKVPNFYDTLAFVQEKQKLYPEAAENLKKAVGLDPKNPMWKIGLAEALMQVGDAKGAQSAIDGLDALTVQPEQREKLIQLRDAIKTKLAA